MAQSSAPQEHQLHHDAGVSERESDHWFGRTSYRLCMWAAGPVLRFGNLAFGYLDLPLIPFGDGRGSYCAVRILSTRFLRRAFVSPDLTIGEAYMNGEWRLEQGDLAQLLAHLLCNEQRIQRNPVVRATNAIRDRLPSRHRNDPDDSRANASHHYDLGNDLYAAFLDDGMNYSCAFFEDPNQSLRDAQRNKLRISIDRLDVRDGMSVLDIGCGWGELTREIARQSEASRIAGITLADRQFSWARDHADMDQSNRLTYRLEDYRDHAAENPDSYDRIISIGMFEHVGRRQFKAYFDAINRLLRTGGQALIHSIIRPIKGPTSPWLNKYIFPGGYIPTLDQLVSTGKQAGLSIAATPFVHDGFHYATTLRHWRRQFNEAYPSLDTARYDERFRRMWNFYLAGSEASFDSNGLKVAQVLFRKTA